jgi:hypothetical protein
MPVEMMKGQLEIFVDAFKNFADIPNKGYCFIVIKRKNYTNEGTVASKKVSKFCKKFSREESTFNLNVTLHDFN